MKGRSQATKGGRGKGKEGVTWKVNERTRQVVGGGGGGDGGGCGGGGKSRGLFLSIRNKCNLLTSLRLVDRGIDYEYNY